MTSLTELRAFHLVAEAGSFSQAARDNSVTQSTLSAQVRGLEQSAGVRLFERRARGVRLTVEGESLHAVTERMFEAEREAQNLLHAGIALAGGTLRVTGDGAILPARILSHLARDRPDLRFSLTVTNSSEVLEGLFEYRADVGITAHETKDSRLFTLPFARSALVAILPLGHPLSTRPNVALSDLVAERLILRERGSQTRAVFEANLAAAALEPAAVLEVGRQDAVREMIAQGFGLGIGAALEAGHDSRLIERPIRDAAILLTEYAVCLKERRRSPLVRTFFQATEREDWGRVGLT
jgi:aminoethylphosphonate catabolism LysR family transcriptional regulator